MIRTAIKAALFRSKSWRVTVHSVSYQQPYAEYPRPQSLPSGVTPRSPGPHLEAIGEAFTLFQRAWGTYVLATLIIGVLCTFLGGLIEGLIFAFARGLQNPPDTISLIAFLVVLAVLYVLVLIVATGLYYGLASMALKQIRGYPISVGDLFGAFRFSLRLTVTNFIVGIVSLIGFFFCIVPCLWFSGSLSLAPLIAMDQDKGVFESIGESWRVAGSFSTGIAVWAILFVIGLVGALGEIACFVGVLATIPIAVIATCIEYFYFFPEQFGVPNQGVGNYSVPPPAAG